MKYLKAVALLALVTIQAKKLRNQQNADDIAWSGVDNEKEAEIFAKHSEDSDFEFSAFLAKHEAENKD